MEMTVPAANAEADPLHATLASAQRSLAEGDAHAARNFAQSVLIAAKAHGDLRAEAQALACLAQCDRMSSRLRRATGASRRAAQLFQSLGDVEAEASALTILAQVCVLLGRNDEAVEAAALSVRLCDLLPARPDAVLAHNYLGVAYCWSGNFERANASLSTAIDMAARCDPPVSIYQPSLNKAWVEASRLVEERYRTGRLPSLASFRALVTAYQQLESCGDAVTVTQGQLMPIGKTVSLVLAGLLAAWTGEHAMAHTLADSALRSLGGVVTWLDAVVQWLVAEVAWAEQDRAAAAAALREMKEFALTAEHEQLACIAHLLLAQVFEEQGEHAAAQQEYRALRVRERRMRSESVSSREEVINWQLGARQSESRLQQALVASKQFERLSFEDSLTGIANRRCFELTLAERLTAATARGRPLTVAMIDVDRFKAVNDTYTHQVGDHVLKALAAILSTAVREKDLPARLAGDEFVVLFDDTPAGVAEEICERIRAAVAHFDWNALADGLHVTVSIGIGVAAHDDTVESLIHRSDESMYTVKTSGLQSLY